MKALEILITIRNSCKVITPIGDFYNYEKSDALIQEAIAELEALQAPKTCKDCNMYGANLGNGYEHNYCTELDTFTNDCFGCIFHKKDTK